MQVICVAGSNVKSNDSIAIYCSNQLNKPYSSINENGSIVFDINKDFVVQFTSKRTFTSLVHPYILRNKTIIESGSFQLQWNDLLIEIANVKSIKDYPFSYCITLSEGTIYLSRNALSNLMKGIQTAYKEVISVKNEDAFLHSQRIHSLWESSWENHLDMFKKIQVFSKSYAFSTFISPKLLAAFEKYSYMKWITDSPYEFDGKSILQTDFHTNYYGNPLKEFDALVRLTASTCCWDESYAACRAYGAILTFVKKEAQLQCNVSYNFCIEEQWEYDECLKRYISCVRDNYNDATLFGSFVYYLMEAKKVPIPFKGERFPYNLGFQYAYTQVVNDIKPHIKYFIENRETLQLDKELSLNESKQVVTIEDFDLMSGKEFEKAIGEIFKSMGYQVSTTPTTGDQGVDIIAVRNGIRIGIQAKCYTGKVGNSAVQEIVAGKQYYHLHRCMVITNSRFTKSAIELAKANNVTLWDRSILEEKLKSYNFQV